MTPHVPSGSRHSFRFGLPPSLGSETARERAERLASFLQRALGKLVEVSVATSYETLAKDLLSGRADAAWAPPFVCARMEAMGVRVLARGVRRGMSSYRSALVGRAGSGLTLEKLKGATAAWVDRDSVAGYLLPSAFLKTQGLEPSRAFVSQQFTGSYQGALEAVLERRADVTSVFCPPASTGLTFTTGVEDVLGPGMGAKFELLAYTDEAPNDGVPVAMGLPAPLVAALETALLGLPSTPDGQALMRDIFNADRFEVAPRMGYRALYRVALASL
ncbi:MULTISPECIES: phosphate/phosphite/phosphonate ABC transporter substrate-binding protein [unclassified Corallococcus]|uniref:phosphate/phosphite/phosphonate ABC transporter substrate-binding protein n=1 Tax=unclassified Corallococcus TaxID=2685029 RepID=UPI001A8E12A8|nr:MULTISPECIES: phosphate/phosphite/phosphonate ABC transporter substrate-binding protein [unclassified Corallococcus]MBN9682909.1 phosphate/phosphite/phosphonate ABC transporter substrate-binding protein [Corallococcus sp. NCSPR001]WAS85556.1 phosphate/phosphite/phosphonate ABC transporter substrate-binding protein [Corallococcus sp. NCRR]